MAASSGITGSVTSWAGGQNASFLLGVKMMEFSLNADAPPVDVTGYSDAGISAYIKSLYGMTGTMRGHLISPAIGALANVSWSAGGYTANLNSFTFEARAGEEDVTAIGGATEDAYIPLAIESISGTYAGYLDATTLAVLPANSNEPATLTLKIQEQGATDQTITCSAFTTSLGISSGAKAANKINYSYQVNGAATLANSTGTSIWTKNTALAVPTSGALVLDATSTPLRYSGNAFWTSIRVNVAVKESTTVEIDFRFAGAVTIA